MYKMYKRPFAGFVGFVRGRSYKVCIFELQIQMSSENLIRTLENVLQALKNGDGFSKGKCKVN